MSGYSTNPLTLTSIKQQIDLSQLAQGLSTEWTVKVGTEDYWLYKIREALYVARLMDAGKRHLAGCTGEPCLCLVPELALAARHFKLQFVRAGVIQAVPRKNSTLPQITGVSNQGLDTDPRGQFTGRTPGLLGPQTADTIMQAWFDGQPSNTSLHFPDAALEPAELLRLFQLAKDQHLIFFEHQGAITLQRYQKQMDGLHWSPEDLGDFTALLPESDDAE
jgi:hypothetical protein